ncbi:MAG: CRTAC1 family protein [Gammaproteobacteria bacterium]|nr:CRTAC1 family protein [Gammaproteobacteria bacterium]
MLSRTNRKGVSHPAAILVILTTMTACGGGNGGNGSNGGGPPPPVQKQFADATAASGINHVNGFVNAVRDPMVASIAPSSVASGDYDGDGDIDLFVVRGDVGPNLLYRNTGNLVFEDVAAASGLAYTKSASENYRHSAPMFADMDGDRDLDLFLGGLDGDPSLVFENNGDGTFSDVTLGSGIDTLAATQNISAAFGDYDLDGDLDLFVSHWGTRRDGVAPGDTEHLWRNDTDAAGIKFQSVSETAGISPTIVTLPDDLTTRAPSDFTFSPTFARINDDLYPDILSVADFNYSQYFINNQDGTFSNATDTDVMIDGNGMGSAVADYDNDGDLDWFVSSIECVADPNSEEPMSECEYGIQSQIGNRLYRNINGVFEDVTDAAGVASGGWGWGSCFIDFENDGDLDIYHTNGWPIVNNSNDFENDISRAFVSDGAGSFVNEAAAMGLDDTEQGRGVVCADFDNDGDVDILQLHRSTTVSATLWRNGTDNNNFLSVKLNGAAPNTEAVGARISINYGGNTQMREICIGSNFLSQNPTAQTFGIGSAAQVDTVTVQWPDGRETALANVQAGQFITVDHPDL